MPVSTNVNLPKTRVAAFPNRCIACGSDQPDASYRVTTHAVGWWTVLLWHWGQRFSVDVPACASCRGTMRRQYWLRLLVTLGFVALGVLVAGSLLQWYHGPFKKWLALGIALVCLLPVILWETFFSRPIDLTAYA